MTPPDAVSGAATPEAQIPELAREVIRAVKADGYPQFTEHEENAFRALAKAMGEEIPEPISVYEHTDKKVARLESQLAVLRVERDQWEKRSHEWFEKYSTTLNWGCREHDIVARIWAMFGTPSYEELKGRSIYDLINELRVERDQAWNEAIGAVESHLLEEAGH